MLKFYNFQFTSNFLFKDLIKLIYLFHFINYFCLSRPARTVWKHAIYFSWYSQKQSVHPCDNEEIDKHNHRSHFRGIRWNSIMRAECITEGSLLNLDGWRGEQFHLQQRGLIEILFYGGNLENMQKRLCTDHTCWAETWHPSMT